MKKTLLRTRLLFLAIMAILMILSYLMYHDIQSKLPLAIALGMLTVIAVVFTFRMRTALRKALIKNAVRVLKESEKDNSILGTVELHFGDEKIRFSKAGISSEINYDKITHIVESELNVFLYFSPVQAVIVPKRCFADDSERTALVSLVKGQAE